MSVFIAIGHGKSTDGSWDAGCTYENMSEAELMKPITEAFVAYMRGSGVKVYTDAPANDKNMIKDVAWANSLGVKVYISIHCDYKLAPSGTIPLYTSGSGKKLAKALNKSVVNGMHMKTRGICHRSDLYELNATNAVACIFECGSISKDYKVFKKHPNKYGKYLAKGLCKYLGVKFTGKKA